MSPTTQTPLASPELSSAASSAPDFNVKNGAQKLLPLNLDPSVGAIFLLVKNSKHGADGGWSPRLMQLRGEDLFFAAGERPSTRVSKYGGATYVIFRSPGPSTRSVFLICLAGSIFLMFPQNLKTTDTSGLEIRQRKSDSSMLFLLVGFASLVCSILIIFCNEKVVWPRLIPSN